MNKNGCLVLLQKEVLSNVNVWMCHQKAQNQAAENWKLQIGDFVASQHVTKKPSGPTLKNFYWGWGKPRPLFLLGMKLWKEENTLIWNVPGIVVSRRILITQM